MAVFHALGDALVADDELHEKQALGTTAAFNQAHVKDPATARLELSTGLLTGNNMRKSLDPPAGDRRTGFKEIGPGKPLTIEIRHVYTGELPAPSFFDKTKDMLVTSAIKSLASFNAAPRAVNFLERNVQAGHNVKNPAATEKGTPLVFYSPALTEKNTLMTIELGFDEFPDEIFGVVGQALTQAAGIPLFVAANAHLLAAGAITKLIGDLGSRVFDQPPLLQATEPLTFLRPGDLPPQADFRLITSDDADPEMLKKFHVGKGGQLVDSGGNAYSGSTPYVVISLDGHKNSEYEKFAPTSASAAVLERFYSIKAGQEQPLAPLMDALNLYNDWKFRKKADDLATELEGLKLERLKPGSKEYKETEALRKEKETQYKAAVANIMDKLLKPKEQA